jgi:hypothetical protein
MDMATENLKKLAQWDAANHTTLLVRKSAQGFTATFLRGDGTYSVETLDLQQLADAVAAVIKSASSHSTGSFVMSVDLVAQGTVGGPKGPTGPGGEWQPVLQSAAIDVHMQLRGLAEKVELS